MDDEDTRIAEIAGVDIDGVALTEMSWAAA